MEGSERLLTVLKQALRNRRLTYREVATGLDMSEANVKRLFASNRISIDRVEAICRLLDMELGDLFQLYEDSRQRISRLTMQQEQELVSNAQLLFVAVCVRNHLSYEQILQNYNIEQTALIRSLAHLDRLKIIDLLPENRIKLRVAENFHWIPNGPIEKFYEQAIQQEFLKEGFDDEENPRQFLSGLLSEQSRTVLIQRLQSIAEEFHQLQRQDRELAFNRRVNIGFLLALREWEFSILEPYNRR